MPTPNTPLRTSNGRWKYMLALWALVAWLLTLSFAGGISYANINENTRHISEMRPTSERLARIEQDVQWIKARLQE